MKNLLQMLADFPFWLDKKLRRFDLWYHRTDLMGLRKLLKLAQGYSHIPVWLPIPLLAFLFYGPLIFDRWRGIWPAVGLGATILLHLFSCRIFRGRQLAWAQWGILVSTSVILYAIANDTAHPADATLYPHMLKSHRFAVCQKRRT